MIRFCLLPQNSIPVPTTVRFIIVLTGLVVWLSACGHSARQHHEKDIVHAKLAEGDTVGARRILTSVNWRKKHDPDLMILLSQLHRTDGTIIGRLKAQQLMEYAVGKFPDNDQVHIELGKTYYEQTFYPDAASCFHTALDLNPAACEAHYLLAANHFRKWKRNQHFEDELTNASRHFDNAALCAPDSTAWSIDRAICHYCQNKLNLAYKTCRDVIRSDSTCVKMFFLQGAIAFRQEQFAEAEKAFDRAISLLAEEEKDPYLDIEVLLSVDEKKEYQESTPEERQRYRRMFWMALDPDPTVPLNERYLEHIGRTFLADIYFSNDRPPLRGWETERGKALIKFGWPASIHRTLANMRSATLDGWAEVWHYEGDYPKEFIFVDEFLNGAFCIPRDVTFANMAQVLLNTAAESAFTLNAVHIPGDVDVVAFKNGTISSSIYTIAKIDADSLLNCLEGSMSDFYIMRGVFFNSAWKEQERFKHILSGDELALSQEADKKWLYASKEIIVPFDQFRISLALCDPLDKTRSIYRDVATAERFLSDSLSASDVLLFRDSTSYSAIPKLERRGMSFAPNPDHSYEEGEKLNIYLEIYNLVQHQSIYEYDVSYMIFQRPDTTEPGGWLLLSKGLKWFAGIEEKRPPFIIQTATRQSIDYPAKEIMSINIDTLQEGAYLLRVSIFDKYSGKIAETATSFAKRRIMERSN
jgi:GWxTD domain-containing protein